MPLHNSGLTYNCPERATLLMAYEKATRVYSQAVLDLSRAVGAMAYSEYQLLKGTVALARQASEQARQNLEEHVREHAC